MMGYGGNGGFFLGGWLMGLAWLLILAGVVVLTIWLVQTIVRRDGPRVRTSLTDPLTALQLRLARGEITLDEYEALRTRMSR